MPVRPILPHTRRERVANYGGPADVVGSRVVTLFQMSAEQSDSLAVYVETTAFSLPDSAIGTGDFRPYVRLDWGHGGSFASAEFEVTKRQRIAIVGSTVDLKCFIKSLPLATADGFVEATVPTAATASFRAFMGEGLDGIKLYPTHWVTQFPANAGLVSDRTERLASLRAFAIGGATSPAYLLLFDQDTIPVGGETPVDCLPLIVPPVASGMPALGLGQTRAFVAGVAWAISSTPFVNTLVAGAQAFVCAELES
jgi:hypothetical protein